jgi:hypothetical protein
MEKYVVARKPFPARLCTSSQRIKSNLKVTYNSEPPDWHLFFGAPSPVDNPCP